MASSNSDPSPPSLEELSTRGATAFLLPWILGMTASADSTPREVAVFVHQSSRSITLVEGSLDIESLLREIPSKEGYLPATKASIESLPRVQVSEPGWECAICLSEGAVNVEVKEMPCRHKFHSGCIDKWLGIHGSCPICRFGMPVDQNKEISERDGWRIHVFFSRERRDPDLGTGRDEDEIMEREYDDVGDNGGAAEDMDTVID